MGRGKAAVDDVATALGPEPELPAERKGRAGGERRNVPAAAAPAPAAPAAAAAPTSLATLDATAASVSARSQRRMRWFCDLV